MSIARMITAASAGARRLDDITAYKEVPKVALPGWVIGLMSDRHQPERARTAVQIAATTGERDWNCCLLNDGSGYVVQSINSTDALTAKYLKDSRSW